MSESAHDGTKYKKWIVVSQRALVTPGKSATVDDNKMLLESIEKEAPGHSIGNAIGAGYGFSSWQNARGQWKASVVQTDRGFYLSLENIVLG